ncbi:MFS transporter [Streptomyces sp. NPDC048506]|uniref:MFS transporter n=1 Tax=Streptomyces sp. NPDC048506 TaxID=3155028 RepID=UPI00341D845F
MLAGLRSVFAVAGVGLPVLSFLARLPAALCPIGTLLMLTELDGIGRAGVVAGMLWLGQAVGGTPIGRLADRRGHRPVILVASLANAVAIVALAGAVLGGLPVAVQALLAGLVGVTMPQVGPLSRTRWIALTASRAGGGGSTGGKELTGRALSLDTTIDEISFMAGPALAATVVVLVHPAAGLLLAAVLSAVCGVLFALHPTAPGPVRTGRVAAAGVPLVSPGLMVLCAMALAQGLVWGAANAGVSALSKQLGEAGMAGFVWGSMAVTSALAGLVCTALPVKRDLTVRLRLAIVAQTLLVAPLLVVDGFAGATLAIAGIGAAVAPHLIAVFGLGERVAPAARMGEAMALLGSGLIVGQCLAAVAAGPLAQAYGYRAAFGLSCAAGLAACGVALLLVRGRWFTAAGAGPVLAAPPVGPAPSSAASAAGPVADHRA